MQRFREIDSELVARVNTLRRAQNDARRRALIGHDDLLKDAIGRRRMIQVATGTNRSRPVNAQVITNPALIMRYYGALMFDRVKK